MLTLKKAKEMADAALQKASELNVTIAVAIVDSSGNILVINRMEGAFPVSPKFAVTKAYTAATLGMSTKDMEPYAIPGKPYYGLDSLSAGEFTTIAGGIPIKKDGKVIGGIGIGGSYDVSQDVSCAEAALTLL